MTKSDLILKSEISEVEEEPVRVKEPTPIAEEIRRLQAATLASIEKRERLPQPLFWSLFHSELEKVRRAKKQERLLQEVLDKLG